VEFRNRTQMRNTSQSLSGIGGVRGNRTLDQRIKSQRLEVADYAVFFGIRRNPRVAYFAHSLSNSERFSAVSGVGFATLSASRRTLVRTRPDRLETGDGGESTVATSLPRIDWDSKCPETAYPAGNNRELCTPAAQAECMPLHAGRRLVTDKRHSRLKQVSP